MSIHTHTLAGTITFGLNNNALPLKLSYDASYVVDVGVSSLGALSFTLPAAATTSVLSPMFVETSSTPQMTLRYDGSKALTLGVSSDGVMSMQTTGTYIDFNSANQVRVLNNTPSTSTTTGCMILSGGLGVAGTIYTTRFTVVSTSTPQLTIKYGTGAIYNSFATDSSGNLTITSTGTQTIHFANLLVDASYRVFGRIGTSYSASLTGPWLFGGNITITLEKWGYMVYMTTTLFTKAYNNASEISFSAASQYIPAAYRPVDNQTLPAIVINNSINLMGGCRPQNTGQCYWSNGLQSGNFTAGTCGIQTQTLCWMSGSPY